MIGVRHQNIFVLSPRVFKTLVTRGMDLRCKCTIGGPSFSTKKEAEKYGEENYPRFKVRRVKDGYKVFNGPCNVMLLPHDKVVSKPSKRGRKYYLFEHYKAMYFREEE